MDRIRCALVRRTLDQLIARAGRRACRVCAGATLSSNSGLATSLSSVQHQGIKLDTHTETEICLWRYTQAAEASDQTA